MTVEFRGHHVHGVRIRTTRAATVVQELLGKEFQGVVMCDRAKMYWWLPRLQWCWAHLKRDFQALIDSNDRQEQRLGRDLMPHAGTVPPLGVLPGRDHHPSRTESP